jgi:phosphatidyl-myo-inositol dimannoside synthase
VSAASALRRGASLASESKCILALFPELLGVGGVQEAGRQTAAALDEFVRRHDWSLDLLSLNDESGARVLRMEGREISFAGFGRAKVPFVFSALARARDNAKIILAAHPHLALPAMLAKMRAAGSKTIVMSHGIEVWKRLPFLRRRALQQANCILAPSSDTARKLADVQSVRTEKIRRLPWPVNAEILRMADASSTLPVPQEFPQGAVVLTVGRWSASERYKGADDLIEAIAQLQAGSPELQLVAVGGGDDLPRLRQFASDCGVANRVTFLEGLTREQIAACYARCDIFALPSAGEGFGLVFLEAMAFGKPVIGADSGGIPDLVENGANGLLIPPRDRERLAEALKILLADAPLRARLGRHGAEIVRRKHSFAAFKSELGEILDDAVAQ